MMYQIFLLIIFEMPLAKCQLAFNHDQVDEQIRQDLK